MELFKVLLICSALFPPLIASSGASVSTPLAVERKCPDAIIDWVDMVMINDIRYSGLSDEEMGKMPLMKGKKLGTVTYKMADNACSDHQMKNGDAAFLPVGTELYELQGYDPSFRILANGRVYQVNTNPQAKTVADLYDIEGKVSGISIRSEEDGSYLADFTPQATEEFVREYLAQPYVGFDKVYGDGLDGKQVFLRFHLKDGSSFVRVIWLDEHAMNPGNFTTPRMEAIVQEQLKQVQKK
ncbi:hypothetical protein [Brevibacillus dissolubilis]|uniref:hypothetical protein n=1 Tax=Brevibacillus dissolubilis TaxID=1844116 RepID=UPI001116C267|nr:hypothetical protein [Brevibacillus dissolubilis]